MGSRLLVDQSLVGIAYALGKCVNLVSQVSQDILFKETIGMIFLEKAVVGFSYLLPGPGFADAEQGEVVLSHHPGVIFHECCPPCPKLFCFFSADLFSRCRFSWILTSMPVLKSAANSGSTSLRVRIWR